MQTNGNLKTPIATGLVFKWALRLPEATVGVRPWGCGGVEDFVELSALFVEICFGKCKNNFVTK